LQKSIAVGFIGLYPLSLGHKFGFKFLITCYLTLCHTLHAVVVVIVVVVVVVVVDDVVVDAVVVVRSLPDVPGCGE